MIPTVINKLRWFFWIGLVVTIIQLFLFGFFPKIVSWFNLTSIQFFEITSWVITLFFIVVIVWELILVRGIEESVEEP